MEKKKKRNQNSLTPDLLSSSTAQSPEAEMLMWSACNQEKIIIIHF